MEKYFAKLGRLQVVYGRSVLIQRCVLLGCQEVGKCGEILAQLGRLQVVYGRSVVYY